MDMGDILAQWDNIQSDKAKGKRKKYRFAQKGKRSYSRRKSPCKRKRF